MATGMKNDRSTQFSFRLPNELVERVEAYARRRGVPRNRAVVELLGRGLGSVIQRDSESDAVVIQSDAPGDTPQTDPDLIARIDAIEAKLEELMQWQTPRTRPPVVFDEAKHFLGPLCSRGHEWEDTGKSRRSRRNGMCMACEAKNARAKRAARKAERRG